MTIVMAMASIHKDPRGKSPYWYASFTLPNGRRTLRSTKATDSRKAQQVADKWAYASKLGRRGRLTESVFRKGMADIYEMANGESLPSSTAEKYFDNWIATRGTEISESTLAAYKGIKVQFLAHLGDRKGKDVAFIRKSDIAGFRDSIRKRGLSPATANLALKVIRSALKQAQMDGIISENPAERVGNVKGAQADSKRRAFTVKELENIFGCATDEWRGMILFGLYTGQRLGDIAGLTWANVDLTREELKLVTGKTGRRQIIPLAVPLLTFIEESLPASDDPRQPLFPKAAARKERTKGRVAALSNQFHEILETAGLAKARSHQKEGEGRSAKRETSDLSFHCLRHTATSLLKNAGISPAIVQEFVGHDSKAVSQNYTHIDTETLRKAARKFPDITSNLAGKAAK